MKARSLVLLLGTLSTATSVDCGGEPPSEELATESVTGALETQYDKIVKATTVVSAGDANASFVFAIDTSNRLQRKMIRTQDTPTTNAWQQVDTGVADGPVSMFCQSRTMGVYARGTDGNLWEYWYYTYMDDPLINNISSISGIGQIAGAPVIVEADNSSCAAVLAVRRASDNSVYTVSWSGASGWSTAKVLRSGSTAIKTANSLRATPFAIAGRGMSDDTTSWIAARPNDGGLSSPNYTLFASWDGGTGSPYPIVDSVSSYGHAQTMRVWALFGTQLKVSSITRDGWFSWQIYSGCASVGGSPEDHYIRGSNGHLLQFLMGTADSHTCYDLGEGLSTAPTWGSHWQRYTNGVDPPAYVLFRGNSGHLWARSVSSGQHWDTSLSIPL
jgi:hypothetical protein